MWAMIMLAISLVIGLWTRTMAALCLGLLGFSLLKGGTPAGTAAQLLVAAAIVLLGGGAYSADALMFGRRTIVLGGGKG